MNRTYTYAGIVQTAPYTTSAGALTSLTLKAADPNATATVIYDGSGLPSSLTIQSVSLSVNPSTVNQNQTSTSLTGQTKPASTTAVQLDDAATAGSTPQNLAGILMSYTPSGGANTTFQYQTFGPWAYNNGSTGGDLSWFSYGIPTSTALPTSGTATYAGIAVGYYFDTSGTLYATTADMSATANFAAPGATTPGAVTFNTTNTNMVLASSPSGTGSANSALDLSGTLTITGNNFTGTIANSGGNISGNATGLFYGPGIATATSKSVYHSPAEIGGTYAATGTGGAVMGAFGGKAQ